MKFLCALVFLFTVNAAVGESVYKWTDANGNVHFGDRAAAEAQKKTKEINVSAPITHWKASPKTKHYLIKKTGKKPKADPPIRKEFEPKFKPFPEKDVKDPYSLSCKAQ